MTGVCLSSTLARAFILIAHMYGSAPLLIDLHQNLPQAARPGSHRVATSAAACLNSFQHGKNLFFSTASTTTPSAATALPVPWPLTPIPLVPLPLPFSLSPTHGAFASVGLQPRAITSAFWVSFRRNGCGSEALVSSTMRGVVG